VSAHVRGVAVALGCRACQRIAEPRRVGKFWLIDVIYDRARPAAAAASERTDAR